MKKYNPSLHDSSYVTLFIFQGLIVIPYNFFFCLLRKPFDLLVGLRTYVDNVVGWERYVQWVLCSMEPMESSGTVSMGFKFGSSRMGVSGLTRALSWPLAAGRIEIIRTISVWYSQDKSHTLIVRSRR